MVGAFALGGLALLPACTDSAARTDALGSSTAGQPLAHFQAELLELAFEAASALPVDPHAKNRSRAQASVVEACLELEQPQRARIWTEKIDGWRRGAAYADLAHDCAVRGDRAEAVHFLELAEQELQLPDDGGDHTWRRDRIRAKIARTHVALGNADLAAPYEAELLTSEAGTVQVAKARRIGPEEVDAQLASVDEVVARGDFDAQRNALAANAQHFDRFYGDVELRSRVEAKIQASWHKLPVPVRLELLLELARFSTAHGDAVKTGELLDQAHVILASVAWAPEDQIALQARLATLRHGAGDSARARQEADAALATFESQRGTIVNIDRAGALRPIAEAYHAMGERAAALAVYSQAVEAGVENPNSRPRAEDLCATCLSMARVGFEPDAALRARLRQVQAALGPPW